MACILTIDIDGSISRSSIVKWLAVCATAITVLSSLLLAGGRLFHLSHQAPSPGPEDLSNQCASLAEQIEDVIATHRARYPKPRWLHSFSAEERARYSEKVASDDARLHSQLSLHEAELLRIVGDVQKFGIDEEDEASNVEWWLKNQAVFAERIPTALRRWAAATAQLGAIDKPSS